MATRYTKEGYSMVTLNGVSDLTHEIMLDNGAWHLCSGFETWCDSDTCAHHSHDEGQDHDTYLVPTSWLPVQEDITWGTDGWERDMLRLSFFANYQAMEVREMSKEHWASTTTIRG